MQALALLLYPRRHTFMPSCCKVEFCPLQTRADPARPGFPCKRIQEWPFAADIAFNAPIKLVGFTAVLASRADDDFMNASISPQTLAPFAQQDKFGVLSGDVAGADVKVLYGEVCRISG